MLKKISVLIFVVALLLPVRSLADETPKLVDLAVGQKAPFAGTLLNPTAVAQMIADKENLQVECTLAKTYVEGREKAKCDLMVNSVDASLRALETRNQAILFIKDEEITRLNQLALNRPNKNSHWWFSGGVVVGIITSVVIFYAAVKVTHE